MHITTSSQAPLEMGFGEYSCNWGVHICGLYESAEERDEIILGFLHQGDRAGDLQFYCPFERSAADFEQTYAARYPDCRDHPTDPARFRLSSARDLYYPDGTFSPWAMDAGLTEFFIEPVSK